MSPGVSGAVALNHHRRRVRTCYRKRTYGTRREAKEGCLKGCHPYHCPYCGWWHNGHPRRKRNA